MKITASSNDLKNFCDKAIENSDYIAIDTEFVRNKTYYPILCLLQLAFKEKNIKKILVLDTFNKKIDFNPFINLLKNDKIIKVFHAGRQDCEIFLNNFNCLPQNIFDTQIGAMVCGIGEQESYESLVLNFLRIKINKSFQYTDWSKRPMSESQIKYAANDVFYLCDIYEQQKKLLMNLDRSEWIIEENKKLSDKSSYNYNLNSIYKKIKGNKTNKNKNLILDLLDLREKIAKKLNLPRNQIIKDSKLMNIVKLLPCSLEELEKLSLFTSKEISKTYNKKLFTLINKSKQEPSPKDLTNNNQDSIEYSSNITNFLKILLKLKSSKYGVPTRLIASNQDLEKILSNQKENIPALKGWRWKVFGEDAIKLKNGEIAMYLSKQGIKLINI